MRRLIALLVVAAVVSVAVWWFGLYDPAREQQLALENEIAALRTQESQLDNQRRQLRDLEARAPEIRQDLNRLSGFIPPDPDQARLLELLQAAGNAAGVTFTALAFTDPLPDPAAPPAGRPEQALGVVTVTGSVDATYFQLMDFLRRLEVGSSRAVLVTAVSLSEGDNGFPDLTASFTARIFALIPQPLDPGVVPAPEVEGEVTPATPPPATPAPAADAAEDSTPAAADGAESVAPTDGDGEDLQVSAVEASSDADPMADMRGRS